MKLPRWLVLGLLTASGLAIIGALVWWWTTWPERAAQQFVALVRQGKLDEAASLMPNVQEIVKTPGIVPTQFEQSRLTFVRRGAAEIIRGRARFRIHDVPYQFQVEWGTITSSPDGWSPVPTTAAWNAMTSASPGWTAPSVAREQAK